MNLFKSLIVKQAEDALDKSIDTLVSKFDAPPSLRPNIEFIPKSPKTGNIKKDKINNLIFQGYYDLETDTIYIITKKTRPSIHVVVDSLLDNLFVFSCIPHEIVYHEIGHAYQNHLLKQIGSNGRDFRENVDGNEAYARALIDEGIAMYFEYELNNSHPDARVEWAKRIDDFLPLNLYSMGYNLVKPIIDQHRTKGVIHMLFNPMPGEELFLPLDYQERTLSRLAT
tara:strand:+ start:414 stop:1091 length:678 start_codon:yes stop_codon:yes gene_type:complete